MISPRSIVILFLVHDFVAVFWEIRLDQSQGQDEVKSYMKSPAMFDLQQSKS